MLAIRMKRTGRRGHAQYRVVVQDSRQSPASGRVVAFLGSYNPHTKTTTLDTEKASNYLSNGAQPSDRVAKLLKKEGVKLPEWVSISPDKKRPIKHAEKLRRNQPKGAEPQKAEAEEPVEVNEEPVEAPEETVEAAPDEAPAEPAEPKTEESSS